MKVQHRYVEYAGNKKVYSGPWVDHCGDVTPCPEGCLRVESGMSLKEAREWKKKFEVKERKAGCSNFEYRVVV